MKRLIKEELEAILKKMILQYLERTFPLKTRNGIKYIGTDKANFILSLRHDYNDFIEYATHDVMDSFGLTEGYPISKLVKKYLKSLSLNDAT